MKNILLIMIAATFAAPAFAQQAIQLTPDEIHFSLLTGSGSAGTYTVPGGGGNTLVTTATLGAPRGKKCSNRSNCRSENGRVSAPVFFWLC